MVRFERLRRDVSVKDLTARAGVDAGRYRNFERGDKYRKLNDVELEGVAECLRIPREMFADAKGAPRMMA
ncbi:hypothetical protein [Pyramidobacter piscolens]|uniref:hypothetical protein n=1 Tax=Pyramidobacter piscolens TaxID=638849 RepID=UPI0026666776|nr:hypothetical protein [Pyramidobacter piscolens]